MTLKITKGKVRHPCQIIVESIYNHQLNFFQVNSFKDISTEASEKVKESFKK